MPILVPSSAAGNQMRAFEELVRGVCLKGSHHGG